MAKTKEKANKQTLIYSMVVTGSRRDIMQFMEQGRKILEEERGYEFISNAAFVEEVFRSHPLYQQVNKPEQKAVPA